jgi:hypothetical protein
MTLQTMFDLHNSGTQVSEEFIDTGVEVVYPDTLEAFLETPH